MVQFQQGLLITAVGMGLVFFVIILLWGLMALLMRITSRPSQIDNPEEDETRQEPIEVPEIEIVEKQRQAAAAAVAVGVAKAESRFKKAGTDKSVRGDGISPWQVVNRLRQLEKRKR